MHCNGRCILVSTSLSDPMRASRGQASLQFHAARRQCWLARLDEMSVRAPRCSALIARNRRTRSQSWSRGPRAVPDARARRGAKRAPRRAPGGVFGRQKVVVRRPLATARAKHVSSSSRVAVAIQRHGLGYGSGALSGTGNSALRALVHKRVLPHSQHNAP